MLFWKGRWVKGRLGKVRRSDINTSTILSCALALDCWQKSVSNNVIGWMRVHA